MSVVDDLLSLRLEDSQGSRIQDIARHAQRLTHMSSRLRGAIVQYRDQLLRELDHRRTLDRLASRMADGLFLFLADQYQYLDLEEAQRRDLRELYRRLLDDFRDWLWTAPQRFTCCPPLSGHHNRLTEWTRRALHEVGGLGWADASDKVVMCGTYSPELQLELLHLDIDTLAQPVLDLGCGREAHLVQFIRRMGVSAYGFDRLVTDAPGVTRGSWFEAPLDERSWGTVIAHLSFTLHFLNAHLVPSDRAARYARQYMRILGALRPGGCFAYAPGLPFIEELLDPREYEIRTGLIFCGTGAGSQPLLNIDWTFTQIVRRKSVR